VPPQPRHHFEEDGITL
jgi:hypothetical protein